MILIKYGNISSCCVATIKYRSHLMIKDIMDDKFPDWDMTEDIDLAEEYI